MDYPQYWCSHTSLSMKLHLKRHFFISHALQQILSLSKQPDIAHLSCFFTSPSLDSLSTFLPLEDPPVIMNNLSASPQAIDSTGFLFESFILQKSKIKPPLFNNYRHIVQQQFHITGLCVHCQQLLSLFVHFMPRLDELC